MRGRALGAGVPPHPRRVRSPKTTITSAKRTTPGAGKARRWVTVAVTARTCCPKQLESTQNPKQPRRSVEHPLSGHFNSPPLTLPTRGGGVERGAQESFPLGEKVRNDLHAWVCSPPAQGAGTRRSWTAGGRAEVAPQARASLHLENCACTAARPRPAGTR